jgi:UPF0042 nucleotide-binding protein
MITVVLITGLSGAGRTLALKSLEDLGYEAVDNLPLSLVGLLLEPLADPEREDARNNLAVAVDFRTRDFSVEAFDNVVGRLSARDDVTVKVVFLDCDSERLAQRFTETRRRHPLAEDRPVSVGIEQERLLLAPIAERANLRIDTSLLSGADLRRLLEGHFKLDSEPGMTVSLMSFGFRRGLPREADLVFDVRFLANPHYVEALRPRTGRDPEVGAYVAADENYEPFMARVSELLNWLLPLYHREGKSYLTVAIGCTGGQHRSVFIAEQLGEYLHGAGHDVLVRHRDVAEGDGAAARNNAKMGSSS